ncbi:MAG: hypothetical protein ACXQTI_07730 [Candidatus Nezhaarchaeales archaeon]
MAVRKLFKAFEDLPNGVSLRGSYVKGLEAWSVYEAEKEEGVKDLELFLKERVPEMNVDIKRVSQLRPLAPETYTSIIFSI